MNKTLIAVIVIVAIILVVGIIAYSIMGGKQVSQQSNKVSSIIECDNISNINYKDICYSNIAENNKNVSICRNIDDEHLRIQRDCIANSVLSNDNITTACSQFSMSMSMCYSFLAKVKQYTSICEGENSDIGKDNCYSYFALNMTDVSICNKVSDNNKAFCLSNIATATKNISVCLMISNSSDYKDLCKKWVNEAIVNKTNN